MLNYTAYSREATEIEVDRYVTWPGQACAYKLGEIKIKELRTKAEEQLGIPKINIYKTKEYGTSSLFVLQIKAT